MQAIAAAAPFANSPDLLPDEMKLAEAATDMQRAINDRRKKFAQVNP